MATQPKPTLREIAAMPYPASERAMREHYDKNWHRDLPEADEDGKRKFRVRFDWEISGSFDDEVEAGDEEEAEDIAREMAADNAWSVNNDLEVSFVRITPADPKELAAAEAYAQAMSTGTAKTPKAVEGRSPASAVREANAPVPSPPDSPS
jgi:hypothetical protein